MKTKTIIVSNRLPLNVSVEEGNVKVFPSVGGLATGMTCIHQDSESLWIGWAGVASDESNDAVSKKIRDLALKETCVRVPLTQQELDDYYFGFSSRVLWPLFQYFMEYADYQEA